MAFSKAGLDHEEARTEEQKKLMAEIEADGVCPFCAANFRKYHPKPILKETTSWFFTENISPYDGTLHHYIFVYKIEHITTLSALPPQTKLELFDLVDWASKTYDIPGGSFFIRFGRGEYNGSSVEHLHAHLISGSEKSHDTEAVRVKLSYKKIVG